MTNMNFNGPVGSVVGQADQVTNHFGPLDVGAARQAADQLVDAVSQAGGDEELAASAELVRAEIGQPDPQQRIGGHLDVIATKAKHVAIIVAAVEAVRTALRL
jgi:hypothetical protein